MKDYTKDPSFWVRLLKFVSNVQTGCMMGDEEKDMIINVCVGKIEELENLKK